MTSFEVPLSNFEKILEWPCLSSQVPYGNKKEISKKRKGRRGRAGIEPATSPTRRENHTSRPTALDGDNDREAPNEDRTRDLVLTRHMLCQLSYRGETRAPERPKFKTWGVQASKTKKVCIGTATAASSSRRLTLH